MEKNKPYNYYNYSMIFSVATLMMLKLAVDRNFTWQRLFRLVHRMIRVIPFCCSRLFTFFISRPNIMYPSYRFDDEYCNILRNHYVDRRKYHLEDKIVTLPVPNPAFTYSHLN
jgi:hypothetical protein